MDEYIEREALLDRANLILAALKKIEKSRSIGKINGARIAAIASLAGIMKETPAADVAPVVHGKWYHTGEVEWSCTNCGNVIATKDSWECPTKQYCDECGARMDGGKENAAD